MQTIDGPPIITTVKELIEFLSNCKNDTIILTGERGMYTYHTYIAKNGKSNNFNHPNSTTWITNEYFDQRDNRSIKDERGGITRSYEYHIYEL